MLGRLGDAHAQGTGPEFGAGLLHPPEARLYAGHEDLRFAGLGHRQDDQELVAAQPADHVQGSTLLSEDLGHLDQ